MLGHWHQRARPITDVVLWESHDTRMDKEVVFVMWVSTTAARYLQSDSPQTPHIEQPGYDRLVPARLATDRVETVERYKLSGQRKLLKEKLEKKLEKKLEEKLEQKLAGVRAAGENSRHGCQIKQLLQQRRNSVEKMRTQSQNCVKNKFHL